METFSEDVFEFRVARLVGGDKGSGFRVMSNVSGCRFAQMKSIKVRTIY